jgi:hypothetical protein
MLTVNDGGTCNNANVGAEMALPTVVEPVPASCKDRARTGKRKGGIDTKSVDAAELLSEETSARIVLDGVDLPADMRGYGERMMEATTGDAFKPIMRVWVAACAISKTKQASMHKYFLGSNASFRRSRLQGWRAWVNFCGAMGITLETMRTHPMPEQLYEDFLVWMDDPASNISPHTKKDAPPAVQALFDRLRRDVRLNGSSIVQTLRRNTNVSVKAAPKDYVIWPIAIFTDYARRCQNPEEQPWADFMGLSADVLIVFLPARPVALTRMDVGSERIRPLDGNMVVKAQAKTDFGRGKTELVIRSAPEERLSPRYYYDLLRARAKRLGVVDALFCS